MSRDELLRIAGGDEKALFLGAASAPQLLQQVKCAGDSGAAPPPSPPTNSNSTTTQSYGPPPPAVAVPVAPAATSSSGCVFDLVFVMDASGSIEKTYKEELQIANDFVNDLTVGKSNARV